MGCFDAEPCHCKLFILEPLAPSLLSVLECWLWRDFPISMLVLTIEWNAASNFCHITVHAERSLPLLPKHYLLPYTCQKRQATLVSSVHRPFRITSLTHEWWCVRPFCRNIRPFCFRVDYPSFSVPRDERNVPLQKGSSRLWTGNGPSWVELPLTHRRLEKVFIN